jgi:hypothetical protein
MEYGCYYFVNANAFFYIVFTLCKLALYSTGLSHVSNGASYLWQMVHTRSTEESVLDIPEQSIGRGQPLHGPPRGNAPPPPPLRPPVSLKQLLDTQNELMCMLTENDARREAGPPQHPRQQDMDSSYSDFLATHPPLFSEQRTHSSRTTGSTPPNQNSVCYTIRSS